MPVTVLFTLVAPPWELPASTSCALGVIKQGCHWQPELAGLEKLGRGRLLDCGGQLSCNAAASAGRSEQKFGTH
ncbi:hypothetical protein K456DRAFT_960303 [Colletotrichum gloeosporioides 23]|nr:hypothetical protein K456DRAFT_960303 [Colletotrichum gloeosporioides 23]